MWRLPMFGCSDPAQVLKEIQACKKAFPTCYVRLAAFDNISQCQTASFLVHRPKAAVDYTRPEVRRRAAHVHAAGHSTRPCLRHVHARAPMSTHARGDALRAWRARSRAMHGDASMQVISGALCRSAR